ELRLHDVVDLAGRVAGAANLDLHVVRNDRLRFVPGFSPGAAHREFEWGFGGDGEVAVAREIQAVRRPVEDAGPAPDRPGVAARGHGGAAAERDQGDFILAGGIGPGVTGREALHDQAGVVPAGALRRDVDQFAGAP